MKEGSLVVTELDYANHPKTTQRRILWIPGPPIPGEVYEVESIVPGYNQRSDQLCVSLILREIKFTGITNTGIRASMGFDPNFWKEVQPPTDISELLKETNNEKTPIVKRLEPACVV